MQTCSVFWGVIQPCFCGECWVEIVGLNFLSKEGVFVLIDHALIVPILHWVFGLTMMSSEMKISCKLCLLIPFCLCNLDLWGLDLIGFS